MAISLDPTTMGPVDLAVFAFEGDRFTGDIAPALAQLVQDGTVRIIDLAFIRKGADGSTEFLEVVDADVADAFAGLDDEQHDLLNDEELLAMADGLEPATAAMVVVWENTWASRVATAIRDSGGWTVTLQRVPHDAVVTAIEALGD